MCHEKKKLLIFLAFKVYFIPIWTRSKSVLRAFTFRLVRNRSFAYEKLAIGVNTLSKILPDKLYKKLAYQIGNRLIVHTYQQHETQGFLPNGMNEKQAVEHTNAK